MHQPKTLPCKPERSLVLSRLSLLSPGCSLPACRHLTTASLHLSQPSDLCVNRRHRQLALTQHASAHLQGKPVYKCILHRLLVRLMAQLANTVSANVTSYHLDGAFPSNKDSQWTLVQTFLCEAGNLRAAGRRSKPQLTDSANTKIYSTHQELSQCFLSGPLSRCVPIRMGVY